MATNSINYAAYNTASGQVLRIGICANNPTAISHSYDSVAGESFYDGFIDPTSEWFVSGIPESFRINPITASKTTIIANGADSIVFSSIPIGSICTVAVPTYALAINAITINDGTLTFKTYVQGIYAIEIDEPGHHMYTLSFQAS